MVIFQIIVKNNINFLRNLKIKNFLLSILMKLELINIILLRETYTFRITKNR